jgi:hypothetical protein
MAACRFAATGRDIAVHVTTTMTSSTFAAGRRRPEVDRRHRAGCRTAASPTETVTVRDGRRSEATESNGVFPNRRRRRKANARVVIKEVRQQSKEGRQEVAR